MKSIFKKKGSSGFTIIEVTIVLAIAGLIMAIVFVAVPALQRNAHNTQRKSDASHLAGLVNEYASNHAGSLPNTASLSTMYSGEHWSIMTTTPSVTATIPASGAAYGSTTQMVVYTDATCDPSNSTVSTGSSDREFAVGFQIETSGSATNSCVGE